MYIYYQADDSNTAMSIRSDDRWYMIADQDISGTASLFLNVNGNEYPLFSSTDLAADYPGLDGDQTREYYNALIREVFLMLKSGSNCIDFHELEEALLQQYLEQWVRDGYLEEEVL